MDKSKSLEHKILIKVTFYISMMSIVATMANLPIGMYQTAIVTIFGSLFYFLVYLFLKSPKSIFLKNDYIIISFNVYCILLWFFNDGSNGSTILLFIVTYTISSFIIQIKKQFYFTIGSILTVVFLYIIEYFYPNSVLHVYSSRTDRYLDITLTLVFVFIMLKQLIGIIKVNFNNERKQVETKNIELENSKNELTKSKEFFSKLAESIPGVSFQYESTEKGKTKFNYISGSVESLYEISPEEVYKNHYVLFRMLSKEMLKKFVDDLHYSFENLTPFVNEHVITTPSGKIKHISTLGKPEKQQNGSVVWYGYSKDITDRKKEEEKLQKSESNFRFISENTSDGIVVLDTKGIIYTSKSYTKIFGYTEEEQILKTEQEILNLIHPDFRDEFMKQIKNAVENKQPSLVYVYKYLHKNGFYIWREDTLNFIYDNEGKNNKLIIVARDITEKKKISLNFEQVNNMLEQTSSIAKVGGWEVNILTNEVTWTDLIYELYDLDKNDFNPNVFSILKYFKKGYSRKKIAEFFKQSTTIGNNYDEELELISAKGKYKWVRAIGMPLFENGVCVKVFGTIQDITYQKQIDSKLKELLLVAAKTSDAVTITDANAKISWVNDAFEKITEYSLPEVIGKEQKDLLLGKETNVEILNKLMNATLVCEPISATLLNYTKSGKPIWFDITTTPIFDENGVCTNFIDVKKDVTERMQKQEELQILTDVTANQNKRLLNFTYIVSHNIRSHSANLTGIVKLIENADDEEEKSSLFEMLKTSTEKLEETIQNLNEIISVQNNLNQVKAILNLRNELERTFLVVHESILESKITINNTVDKSIEVNVIPAYLDSILLNLITNAIKYKSPERALVINISAKLEDKFIVLCVQDNGLGLDLEKHKEKIFGMYKTFHNNANSRGIGLFITKNQIEAMNGKIAIESEVNVGTTFKIYFKV
ncbi:MAG: PAS domain S-box protein [Bacteroidia bacterium]